MIVNICDLKRRWPLARRQLLGALDRRKLDCDAVCLTRFLEDLAVRLDPGGDGLGDLQAGQLQVLGRMAAEVSLHWRVASSLLAPELEARLAEVVGQVLAAVSYRFDAWHLRKQAELVSKVLATLSETQG